MGWAIDACGAPVPKVRRRLPIQALEGLEAEADGPIYLNNRLCSHQKPTSRKAMPYSEVTKYASWIMVTSLLLFGVYGDNRPRCDSHGYGQPQQKSCTKLILNEVSIDNRITRLFSLKISIKPEDISMEQFSFRVELPFLRENGQYLLSDEACLHQLIIILDGCKIALLAVRFLNGSISYDTSTWEDIRNEAQRLKRLCGESSTAQAGGNLVAG